MNIAVFGSAFNPPSLGHKSVIERLKHYDLVLMVPSIAHAWGKEMLDYSVRCDMVEQFIADLQLPNVQLSLVEQTLFDPNQQKAITTYAVLEHLQSIYPQSSLTFVVGPDNFLNFSKFYNADVITQTWSVLACPETVAVRSTHIRDNIKAGDSILNLTTPSVERYIAQNQLYCE